MHKLLELKTSTGVELVLTEKKLFANNNFEMKTIVTKKTRKNVKEGDGELEEINYEEMKEWIKRYKKSLFGKHNRIQINVLTAKGWRSGHAFDKNDKIDFYDTHKLYKDAIVELDEIYGIQILLF